MKNRRYICRSPPPVCQYDRVGHPPPSQRSEERLLKTTVRPGLICPFFQWCNQSFALSFYRFRKTRILVIKGNKFTNKRNYGFIFKMAQNFRPFHVFCIFFPYYRSYDEKIPLNAFKDFSSSFSRY
jgi:hypothetical protein